MHNEPRNLRMLLSIFFLNSSDTSTTYKKSIEMQSKKKKTETEGMTEEKVQAPNIAAHVNFSYQYVCDASFQQTQTCLSN